MLLTWDGKLRGEGTSEKWAHGKEEGADQGVGGMGWGGMGGGGGQGHSARTAKGFTLRRSNSSLVKAASQVSEMSRG